MSALLGIDFGERRIGLASADAETALPSALCTVERRSDAAAIDEIARVAASVGASALVIGEPLAFDGTRGASCERVARFAAKLRRSLGHPVWLLPETLTTVAAQERLAAMGVRPERYRPGIDALAAALLLEEFLGLDAAERARLRRYDEESAGEEDAAPDLTEASRR